MQSKWRGGRCAFMCCGCCCCLAVGGIYTVLKTKAAVTVEELGEQYCMIGPLNESCVRTEVEVMEPTNVPMLVTIQQMREHGIKVRRLAVNTEHHLTAGEVVTRKPSIRDLI
jgi:hypothetical protein